MDFEFHCIAKSSWVPDNLSPGRVYLRENDWDDFGYRTTFFLSVRDQESGRSVEVGTVKIADLSVEDIPGLNRKIHTSLPRSFRVLDSNFVLLAQDSDVYERAAQALGQGPTRVLFERLNDLALSPDRLEQLANQQGPVASSLLRTVSISTVREQYRRLLSGLRAKSSFSVTYHPRYGPSGEENQLHFNAVADSDVPTNVHAIIGGNGAGKTTTLRSIESGLLESGGVTTSNSTVQLSDSGRFGGILSVRFNAFDKPIMRSGTSYARPRVRRIHLTLGAPPLIETLADPDPSLPTGDLSTSDGQEQFFEATLAACLLDREDRLLRAMSLLARADPLLDAWGVSTKDGLHTLQFGSLSSGHKILLLTIVSLVLYCEERTLILVDEPESHLHPPLLSAFTRALSELVTERNGLALIATHSPIVLQEVPRQCAWIIRRSTSGTRISHPSIETFGENVDALTREVFGLEARESGYFTILIKLAEKYGTFEGALEATGDALSIEAQLILRSLLRHPR